MKKTPLYDYRTPPKRVGLYECEYCGGKHLWDGRNWIVNSGGGGVINPKTALDTPFRWRGLTTKDGK